MKRFNVVIEYKGINRKNQLIVWANNSEEAKKRALKMWGNPTIYKSLVAILTDY